MKLITDISLRTYSRTLLFAIAFWLAFASVSDAIATVRYVAVNSATPTPPYTSWATAATDIQSAVDAANAGDQILVTNGVYQTGGRVVYGALTNRVAVTKAVTVQSVNGPAATVIQGLGAVRCVYLTNDATLVGFTLTNGNTRYSGDINFEQSGGGVSCGSTSAVVFNCVFTGNKAGWGGGGASGGTLTSCILSNNFAFSGSGGGALGGILNSCTLSYNQVSSQGLFGGGAAGSTLNNCVLNNNSSDSGGGAIGGVLNGCILSNNIATDGGGASQSTLNNCILTRNAANNMGGGAWRGVLNNCTITANSAFVSGGGVSEAALNNCTVTSNSVNSSIHGGGADASTLNNCIVFFNMANNVNVVNWSGGTLNYSCTQPLPTNGIANVTSAPLFVAQAASNFRLQANSPCINSGRNLYAPAGPDLDGNPRIVGGAVDMGAYEFQTPSSTISFAWLQQYGLPSDGSADYGDPDADRMNNWQEWIAGTNPTNALSLLRLLNPAIGSGVTVSWQSVSNRTYSLQRSRDVGAQTPFLNLKSNIVGQPGTTSYTDTNVVVGTGAYFYRVSVE